MNSTYETLLLSYPEGGELKATFALQTKDGIAIALANGGIWEGDKCLGNFDGLCGFAHNVEGERKAEVDELLTGLSQYLADNYGIPIPATQESIEPITEEEK